MDQKPPQHQTIEENGIRRAQEGIRRMVAELRRTGAGNENLKKIIADAVRDAERFLAGTLPPSYPAEKRHYLATYLRPQEVPGPPTTALTPRVSPPPGVVICSKHRDVPLEEFHVITADGERVTFGVCRLCKRSRFIAEGETVKRPLGETG
jgi:hypothetical protein